MLGGDWQPMWVCGRDARICMCVCVCVCVGGGGGGGECGCGEMYDVCVCMRKSSVPCVLQLKCNTILS